MIHLHAHSYYSFLAGTQSVSELVEHAASVDCSALALTDTNNVSGIAEFVGACHRSAIKPIVGAELRTPSARATLLARSWNGYERICDIVSVVADHHPPARILADASDEALQQAEPASMGAFELDELLAEHLSSDVLILSRDPVLLNRLVCSVPRDQVYIELTKADEGSWGRLSLASERYGLPLVATSDAYFPTPKQHAFHIVLRAIATNATISTVSPGALADPSQYLCTEAQFAAWFRDIPEALTMREVIRDQCELSFDMEHSKFASYPGCNPVDARALLHDQAMEGMSERYGRPSGVHLDRFRREYDIITALGFTDYFLIAWDVISYARHRNYPYVGRGSGANSIVAYCLGITNVDPIELDLYFERFLNPERASPPDFDIDFSWKYRDDVIRYLFDRHGAAYSAMIGTISTFNPRGAIREVGKVLGFSDAEIRQTTRLLPGFSSGSDLNDPEGPFVTHAAALLRSRHGARWIQLARSILTFPNHYGIHAGGVILAPEPVHKYTATQTSRNGMRITQQDMYSMEDWRLEKLDILSTRGLGTYEDTMRAVARHTGTLPPLANHRVAIEDPATQALMREGRTIGCFYVESPAMIQLLRKLQTDSFEMLTAASSIIRPGVSQSGMMQAFIERYHDPSKINPPHPIMAELLHSTFGVMVYQEDVIKVAHIIGGLRLGEADLLRRAMSGKMRSQEAMRALKSTFLTGCRNNGISDVAAMEIWRQMESFAGYSFCKAHSASYAVLSFQEAWLKAHHPAFFLCSVLNNQGGYYRPDVYIQEAKRLGIRILLPNVQVSEELNACPDPGTIQLGFLHVKGLSQTAITEILSARASDGSFASLPEFLSRTDVSHSDALLLIKSGALDCFGLSRPALAAAVKIHIRSAPGMMQTEIPFEVEDMSAELGGLEPYTAEQVTRTELETLSFAVSSHVLDHYRKKTRGCIQSADLRQHVGQRVHVAGWMVASKLSRTRSGARMLFVNLDDGTGMVDIVLFPHCFSRYGHILHGAGPYRITGRVAIEHGVVTVVADSVVPMGAPDA